MGRPSAEVALKQHYQLDSAVGVVGGLHQLGGPSAEGAENQQWQLEAVGVVGGLHQLG